MILLTAPFKPSGAARRGLRWRPALVSATITAILAGAALTAETRGLIPVGFGRAVAGAAVHSGFLAVGWVVMAPHSMHWRRAIMGAAAVLLAASLAAQLTTWGGLLYLLVPLVVIREAAQIPGLRDSGVCLTGLQPLALGLAAGAGLGGHLLVTASFTLGYAMQLEDIGAYVTAAAYDAGANAFTAEWLFRGALFSHCWRRWDFWLAAAVSTTFAVTRYLLDPALPSTIEVKVGTVFYMSLVGLTACALRATTASLLPGYLTSLVFFAAYRTLAQ